MWLLDFYFIGGGIFRGRCFACKNRVFWEFKRYVLIPRFFTKWSGGNFFWVFFLEERTRIFYDCPYVCPSFYAITFYSIDVLEL